MKLIKHAGVILGLLLLFLAFPALAWADFGSVFGLDSADAVSQATMVLPEQPSGEFYVLLNTERHGKTAEQWNDFFLEQPVDVIMEDLDCLVVDVDAAGIQLAERYQARLAENQMTIRKENGLLAVSRTECGLFDVVILSREVADAFALSVGGADRVVITVGEGI